MRQFFKFSLGGMSKKQNMTITRVLLALNIAVFVYNIVLVVQDMSWNGHWFSTALSAAAITALVIVIREEQR